MDGTKLVCNILVFALFLHFLFRPLMIRPFLEGINYETVISKILYDI